MVRGMTRTFERRLLIFLTVMGAFVVILGVVTAFISYSGGDARQARAQLGCKSLETAIEAYVQHEANAKHMLPYSLEDLVHPPFDARSFLRNGRQDLIDPWGKPYEMESVKWSDGTEFILVKTTSPDGTPISQFGIGKNSRPKP